MNEQKLSVIIPVYDGMPYLSLAIESILNQTYNNFTLLLIDDGSRDNSLEYILKLRDPRVRVIKQNNIGLCNTLNKYIFESTSEFIARLDQDDFSHPTRLEEQITFLENNNDYGCVLSLINRIGAKGYNFGYYKIKDEQQTIIDYDPILYGTIANSTLMIRKETFKKVGGYRQELYPVDDLDFLLRLSEITKIALLNKPLVNYRIHPNAFTFKYFYDIKVKTKYVVYLHFQRLKQEKELSFKDYKTIYKIPDRLNLRDYGELFFRKAGSYWGNKNKIRGLIFLITAFLLNPKNTLNRLRNLSK